MEVLLKSQPFKYYFPQLLLLLYISLEYRKEIQSRRVNSRFHHTASIFRVEDLKVEEACSSGTSVKSISLHDVTSQKTVIIIAKNIYAVSVLMLQIP